MSTHSVTTVHDSYENPLFLSENDDSSLILVGNRLTGVNNFNSWHQSMIIALNSRNKLGFVDGSLTRPADSHSNFATWSKCNRIVRSWLLNSVSRTIKQSIVQIQTPDEIWTHLLNRFRQSNVLRLFQLEQRLHHLRQGNMDVNSYYTKAITIFEEIKAIQVIPLCTCRDCKCDLDKKWVEIFERSFVFKFLLGLNDSYQSVRDRIIMLDPFPDLEKTLNLVIQHEYLQQVVKQYSVSFQDTRQRQRPLVNKCYKLYGYRPDFQQHSGAPSPYPIIPLQGPTTNYNHFNNYDNYGTRTK